MSKLDIHSLPARGIKEDTLATTGDAPGCLKSPPHSQCPSWTFTCCRPEVQRLPHRPPRALRQVVLNLLPVPNVQVGHSPLICWREIRVGSKHPKKTQLEGRNYQSILNVQLGHKIFIIRETQGENTVSYNIASSKQGFSFHSKGAT